jgi:hypothetical protein
MEGAVQFRWPRDRVPVTILLDDPTPCRNPAWYEYPERGNVAVVPNSFTARFADMIERTGAAGKYSVIPCPGAQGCLDTGVPGLSADELNEFLRIVRERIAPRWDISPEMLTHNKALDLHTMQPLDEREDVWAAHQTEATLTPYISKGLQILRDMGLEPNGVTSPWAFGKEVEQAYVGAIVTALREVCDVPLGWYFLHLESESFDVGPRLMRLEPRTGTALVSIVSASPYLSRGHHDFAWDTQFGHPPEIDPLISPDGQSGRLPDLLSRNIPTAFHTHWQSLFSNGSGAGLDALEEIVERLNRFWGGHLRWTSARELAIATAARAATTVENPEEGRVIRFAAPFDCPEFTFTTPAPAGAASLSLDGVLLEQVSDRVTLHEGSWYLEDSEALVCVPLTDGMALEWG